MIRVGYRGYEQGGIYEDTYARANLQGALDAGLDVGVYFFSQAVTVEEAIEEANVVLDLIKDYKITYPVVFDWEWVTGDARSGDITSRTLTDCTKAFCDTIAAAGYTPMFYFNLSMAQTMFRLRELTDYEFWLAQYSDAMTFAYDVQMWQYTCEGTVPGITTAVDLNLSFLDYASAPRPLSPPPPNPDHSVQFVCALPAGAAPLNSDSPSRQKKDLPFIKTAGPLLTRSHLVPRRNSPNAEAYY